MRNGNKRCLIAAGWLLAAFVVWTAAVSIVDRAPIGPEGSVVGFAKLNNWFHGLTGVHMILYTVTDWLGLVPVGIAAGFALIGLVQWIRRKHLLKVDADLLLLGGFYTVVAAVYIFFEIVVINCRPILIGGVLEASYPSSTTLLVLCVMPTAAILFLPRIKRKWLSGGIVTFCMLFAAAMTLFRLISGVHWLTDIIGGILLSGGLVLLFCALCGAVAKKNEYGRIG